MRKISVITLASIAALAFSSFAYADGHKGMKKMMGKHMMHQKMDVNKDGTVSQEEFQTFRANHFAEADKNGDGALSQSDFEAMAKLKEQERQKAMEKAREKRRLEHFKSLDANGDGTVSQEEFTKKGERQFIRMDRNDDGQLNKDDRRKKKGKKDRWSR